MGDVLKRFERILKEVVYPGFTFEVRLDGDRPYMQIRCDEGLCNVTGKPLEWSGRKWFLSEHMTRSEVVQTAFLAAKTAVEHELREKFLYRGQAIFEPHYDVELLVDLCDRGNHRDTRKPETLKPLTDYGDLMTVEEFKGSAESDWLMDYDGHGHPATAEGHDPDRDIYPSALARIPHWATHILWFNR
jgi:hypothetical protein